MKLYHSFPSLIIIVFLFSCSQEKITKLRTKDGSKVIYSSSEKYGYSMGVIKNKGGEYIQYAIRLNGNGEIMYVYKTRVVNDDDEPIAAGPTWYLVSDTANTMHGAEFFNREILGYYGEAMNFITANKFKGESSLYSGEEKSMFADIAELMKGIKEPFIPFDSTRNLFWFKYNLQSH